MNLVVVSDDDDVLSIAPDAVTLDVFPDPEPEVYVSLNGIPGPRGFPGPPGQKGDTGSLGDVNSVPPLYYSASTNTIFLDVSVFDVAGAAASALASAKTYAQSLVAAKPSKYVHSQITAQSSWVVTHGLNTKPNVTIVDSTNTAVFGDIVYDDLNSLHVNFSAPFSGTAYLI